jgi:CRP/FNR family transcriptional regulator, cyclic AMP receptor protein
VSSKDACLTDSPYFTDILTRHPDEFRMLLSIGKPKQYKDGQHVYRQGEKSKPQFYLILSGKIKASILRPDGSEKIIALQEKNTLFGQAAAFDGFPCFATTTAVGQTCLQEIEVCDFLRLATENPKLLLVMMLTMCRTIRVAANQIDDSSCNAQQRVARMLLRLIEVGEKTGKGIALRKKVTHQEIASLLGLSRVSVSVALNRLEEQDILRKKRQTIEITDVEGLKNISGL